MNILSNSKDNNNNSNEESIYDPSPAKSTRNCTYRFDELYFCASKAINIFIYKLFIKLLLLLLLKIIIIFISYLIYI